VMSTDAFDVTTRRASEINDLISQSLRRDWNGRQPVFLFVNYMDAHCPYVPPAPFDTMFPGKTLRFTSHDYYELADEVAALKRRVTPAVRDHLISQYDGSIAYLDSEIGRLIAHLKDVGLYDDALIIITSDHGEMFGERDLLGHGLSVYQSQIDVPLIVKYPHQHTPEVVDEPAGQTDLVPTIFQVLGYPAPAYLQGRSLLVRDRPAPELISESFAQSKFIEANQRFNRVERALVSGNLKLIVSTAGKRELYDLLKDPSEENDICGSERTACANLQQELENWCARIPRSVVQTKKLNKESLDRLRSLGYVQ